MAEKTMTTSWMWAAGGGVNGLHIDTRKNLLNWYDEIGCACNDDDWAFEQPVQDFLANGAPGHIAAVPDDVMVEVRHTAEWLTAERHDG